MDFIKEMKRNCGELSVHLLLNNGGNFYSKSDRIYNIKKYKMQRTRKGPYSICQNIKASHTITSCVRSIFFFYLRVHIAALYHLSCFVFVTLTTVERSKFV